ncbi:hypothetical protein F4V43_07315 [Paenibacillus spiritus]|uniref:Uncharacterized protein n=1 Tax=Paenibacillus spiritus TaxID=2496557 RepID=A0A5J5GEI2_9BACL|nr:hypothetical protein [Paenibacillus spiritus]KAA9005874.1 hypothetical protein F4V43_07315 [Paenibacillus spiritus]
MKDRKQILAAMSALILVTLTGCRDSGKNGDFSVINKSLALHSSQLKEEQGVTLVGYASDPSHLIFQIGIGYDSNLTKEELHTIINDYLSDSVSTRQDSDWHQRLKPYHLIIERIGESRTDFPAIAYKEEGETELTWTEMKESSR